MSKRRAERAITGAAVLFAALGDETRLRLLRDLSNDGPASISVLADRFDQTRQGITKHLHVLEQAGLVDGHREGREHVWHLDLARLREARRCLDLVAAGWESALSRLKNHLEGVRTP